MFWSTKIMEVITGAIITAAAAILGAIIGLIATNIKNYKTLNGKIGTLDNKTLVGLINEKTGKLEDTSLSGQHAHIEEVISTKIGDLGDTTLSGQNKLMLHEVQSVYKFVTESQKEEEYRRKQLTGEQAKIDQSITVLAAFNQKMIDVQYENTILRQKMEELKLENQELKSQLELLEQEQQEDMTDDQEIKLL